MSQQLHFESSFWGQKFTSLPVPDYQAGLRVLHEKLSQSRIENDEIISFLRDRVSVEESYAVKLLDQGQQRSKAKGFLRDEGGTLRKGFDSLRAASELLGSQHMELALNIHEVVLKPLIKVSDDYKADVASAKRNIDMKFKQLDNGVKDVERLKTYYVRKCREADRAEELALNSASEAAAKPTVLSPKTEELESEKEESTESQPVSEKDVQQEEQASGEANTTATTTHSSTYTLAGQVYSADEFEALISKIRQEIPVTEHKVAIFGTYQNTSTGENIARWLQQNIPKCKDSPATADLIGQQLITSYHILKLIGQLGEKFVPSSHHVYQWKTTAGAPDTSPNGIATSALEGVSGIFGKFGSSIASTAVPVQSTPMVAGEEPHKVARREASLADEAYLKAIRKLDHIRLQLEEMLFAHFSDMEQLELNRISTIKRVLTAFIEFGAIMSNTLPTAKAIYDQMLLYQETLKPEQDIQYIIQQYFVSGFAPKSVLYDNFYHGHSIDQSFGVSLVDISKNTDAGIPRIIQVFLSTLGESKYLQLGCVHGVRSELNLPSRQFTDDTMSAYDGVMLAGTLRLYLRELPESVIPSELYEGIKAMYSGAEDNEATVRLQSVAKLLATMPMAHYDTLKALIGYFHKKIQAAGKEGSGDAPEDEQTEAVARLAHSFGSLLLWPRHATYTTANDRHAVQLVKDLLTHYDTIFTSETNEANAEHEKRRLEAPVALHDSAGKDTETEPLSPGGIRRGLMSFVRSAAPDDSSIRKASGVFGAFNRSGYTDSTTTRSPGNKFTASTVVPSPPIPGDSTPDAFIISDEQSMATKLDQEPEEPDVMFDASADHEHDDEVQDIDTNTKPATDKRTSDIQVEGDAGEADKAENNVYSNNLIAEMGELAPSDKEGNDIDPFFEDD
ncbi:hypothetical protein INT44_005024 [Umbelopsis vinacea]|uniref:Uncharacterized protein n=1 Tax=Umbelopsis vinacea TaxID=44442 RepID=A0A8H7Q7L8_9FUNG|nr:hypothetical protein INT44_005024 [Umbelopsis vinacea]